MYRPGAEAILPDALSRREQDTLGEDDKESRFRRFLEPDLVENWPEPGGKTGVEVSTSSVQLLATQFDADPVQQPTDSLGPFQDEQLNDLWTKTMQKDNTYNTVHRAVSDGSRSLPSEVKIKVQIGDCTLDHRGYLRHRGKLWVPGAQITTEAEHNDSDADRLVNDTLRTKLIQSVHNSMVYSHPGQDATGSILARDFY